MHIKLLLHHVPMWDSMADSVGIDLSGKLSRRKIDIYVENVYLFSSIQAIGYIEVKVET